jgi:hypothetical protein
MRRNEKEIQDSKEIDRILARVSVCRIALADGDNPYIVPVNFAREDNALYFHSAKTGKKIDILKKNPRICFEVDVPGGLIENDLACKWGMKYKSVIGFGAAYFIESGDEKKKALDILMKKYSGRDAFSYSDEALDKVLVIGVKIESLSGKRSG